MKLSSRSSPQAKLHVLPGITGRFAVFLPKHLMCTILAVAAAGIFFVSTAQASITLSSDADRNLMVISNAPDSNFGNLGAMEIAAPTISQSRTEEALMGFNTASIKSGFDSYYGTGKWTISWAAISLGSNFPYAGTQPSNDRFNVISPGLFSFSWLSNDNWVEGSVTWNNLSNLLPGVSSNTKELLGTYYFRGDGSDGFWAFSKTSGLVSDILSGGVVTVFGEPGDTIEGTVGYLFNTPKKRAPQLIVCAEATPVPIPGAIWFLGSGLAGLVGIRKKMNRKA
jgi:hypothetical protein